MTLFFVILIIIASVILGLIVLVQNPKGGGLAGNIAGFSNQFMGVKQTTDVLEKGTWIFAAVVGALCLISAMFMPSLGTNTPTQQQKAKDATVPNQPAPANNSAQFPIAPNPGTNPNPTDTTHH